MIKYFLNSRSYLFWIIFHVILGVACTVSPYPLIVWFYIALISSLYQVIRPGTPISIYACTIVYFVSMELLSRMAGTSPYIPYEVGKYLLLVLLLFGIIKYNATSTPALWMVLFLFPALTFDLSYSVGFLDIIFNFVGPLNVGLAILFFKGKKINAPMLSNVFKLILLPLIAVLAYVMVKAPDLNELDFDLGANALAAGGFGSNQVSTGFGLASFLLFIFWLNKWRFSGYYWLDTILLGLFILQGLLTFSRGGMMGGFLSIFVILIFIRFASSFQIAKYKIIKIGKYIIPAFFIFAGSFFIVNELTNGMLLLRYQGETAGTIAGSKVKTLNSITSGRFDIFTGDIELWMDHPILGAGVGASKFAREKMTGIVAHIELSRLLSEHGILGLAYFIILLFYGAKLPRSHPNPLVAGILTACFILGVMTSFHAAMRTFVSPLMIGISMLTITIPKEKMTDNPNKKFDSQLSKKLARPLLQ